MPSKVTLLTSAGEEGLNPTKGSVVPHTVVVQLMQQSSVWYFIKGL